MKVEQAVNPTNRSSPSPKLILTHKQVHCDVSPRQAFPFAEQRVEESEDESLYEVVEVPEYRDEVAPVQVPAADSSSDESESQDQLEDLEELP